MTKTCKVLKHFSLIKRKSVTMNLRTYISILTLSLSILIFNSCQKDLGIEGSGKIIHDFRNITGFNGVSSEGDYDVYIVETVMKKTEIEVVADQNFLPYISTSLSNGTLVIKTINNHYFKGDRLVRYVTVPYVEYFNLSGSGLMTCDSVYQDNMEANLSGSGTISMFGMDVLNLNAKIIGSGEIEMRGKADVGLFEITGSGTIKGYSLRGRLELSDCTVKIPGSGTAYVYVWDHLNIYISGSGDVYYRNSPNIFRDIPGDGSVINDN